MSKLTGLIAAPFTPFDEEENISFSTISDLARSYEKNGVSGAFIIGTTGECASLTHEEKRNIIEHWGKEKGQHLKVVSMVGGTSLREMQELAKHSEKQALDGIAVLSPYYFKPRSVQMLVNFCSEVAKAAPGLPFYYYHIPSVTGGNYLMSEFLPLAEKEIPSLAGIKYTDYNLLDFQTCTQFKPNKYNMLWGTDEALLSGMVAGADGAVGSTYNYAAPLYIDLLASLKKGDLDTAIKKQQLAVAMVEILMKYGGERAGKGFMKLIGIDCGNYRLPIKSLSPGELQEMERDLQKIEFFDFASLA